jgi:hypothetical protein
VCFGMTSRWVRISLSKDEGKKGKLEADRIWRVISFQRTAHRDYAFAAERVGEKNAAVADKRVEVHLSSWLVGVKPG